MTKKKIVMVIHGGASEATPFLKKNFKEFETGLKEAVQAGFNILKKGGSALKAVETSVGLLEDNYLFNAGRGSALNNLGEVEMDAAIMDGKTKMAGAVSLVRTIKNPIILARIVMTKTKHVLLSGDGALALAKRSEGIVFEPISYFITEHQFQDFVKTNKAEHLQDILQKKLHGTVGAVALDKSGNIASATSTGGTSNCLPGRIGDSCLVGAGCYADNKTCAVSGTGEGEVLIRGVVANTIAMLVESKKYTLQEACRNVIRQRNKTGEIGVIAVNKNGDIGISFNTEIMKRAWLTSDLTKPVIKIYK